MSSRRAPEGTSCLLDSCSPSELPEKKGARMVAFASTIAALFRCCWFHGSRSDPLIVELLRD